MARTRPLSATAHALLWPTLLLSLAGWIIALAGISAVQRSCNVHPELISKAPVEQTSALPQVGCRRAFRFPWWILWGSLLPILGVAIAAASNRAHFSWSAPMIGLTVVFATLSMIAANTSINFVDGVWNLGGSVLKRAQTMFSGFLILAAGLLLLLFALGAAMEGRGDDEEEYAGGKHGYERGGAQRAQQQQQQPTVTYGAPTGAATTGVRTTGATP